VTKSKEILKAILHEIGHAGVLAMPSWQHTMVNMVKRWGRQVLCMQIRQPCIRTAIRSSPTFCNKEGVGDKRAWGHFTT